MGKILLEYFKQKLCKINVNYLSKMKECSNCSPKVVLCFTKRAPLFDKRALGQSRSTGGG